MNSKQIAYLIVFDKNAIKQRFPLYEGENTIGRVPGKSQIAIKDPQISTQHAKIIITTNSIILVDVGSKNGTFEMETKRRLDKDVKENFLQGQKFTFGQICFMVERIKQTKHKVKDIEKEKLKQKIQEKKQNTNLLFELIENDNKIKGKLTKQDNHSQSSLSFQSQFDMKKIKNQKQAPTKSLHNMKQKLDINLKQSKNLTNTSIKEDNKNKKPNKQSKQNKKKQFENQPVEEVQQQKIIEPEKKSKEKQKQKEKKGSKQKNNKAKDKPEQYKQNKNLKVSIQQKKKQKQNKQEQEQQNEAKANLNKKKDSKKQKQVKMSKKTTQKQQQEQKQIKIPPHKIKIAKLQNENDPGKTTKNIQNKKTAMNELVKAQKQIKQTKLTKMKNRKRKPSVSQQSQKDEQTSGQKMSSQQQLARQTRSGGYNNTNKNNNNMLVYRSRQRINKITRFMVSGSNFMFSQTPNLKWITNIQQDYDVLIMETYIRTFKLLLSLSKGIPIVHKNWITESIFFKTTKDIDSYWLPYPGDRNRLRKSVQMVKNGSKVFDNKKFLILTSQDKLRLKFEQLQKLIYVNGGQVIQFIPKNDRNRLKDVFIILEQKYDKEELTTAKNINKQMIYTIELVLQSIVDQGMNLEENKIEI